MTATTLTPKNSHDINDIIESAIGKLSDPATATDGEIRDWHIQRRRHGNAYAYMIGLALTARRATVQASGGNWRSHADSGVYGFGRRMADRYIACVPQIAAYVRAHGELPTSSLAEIESGQTTKTPKAKLCRTPKGGKFSASTMAAVREIVPNLGKASRPQAVTRKLAETKPAQNVSDAVSSVLACLEAGVIDDVAVEGLVSAMAAAQVVLTMAREAKRLAKTPKAKAPKAKPPTA